MSRRARVAPVVLGVLLMAGCGVEPQSEPETLPTTVPALLPPTMIQRPPPISESRPGSPSPPPTPTQTPTVPGTG